MNPVTFLRQTISELKQVSWPTRAETTRLTVIVIVMSLATALYVGRLDYSFTNLLKLIIK